MSSNNIIQLNQEIIHNELKDLVRSSVEETLNSLLDKEAEELVNAQKYERSNDRQGYRSGHYKRNFQTTAGEVELKVPKLKGVPFETAIIERYRRRESSVEEALIEMYLAGVSVRRVEDITEALWGTKVSPGTTGVCCLFHNELDCRLVNNGKHFLGHNFGSRKNSCSKSCGRDNSFRNFHNNSPKLADREGTELPYKPQRGLWQ